MLTGNQHAKGINIMAYYGVVLLGQIRRSIVNGRKKRKKS
jgi:hypothetical protein